jgi:hypothetical protein
LLIDEIEEKSQANQYFIHHSPVYGGLANSTKASTYTSTSNKDFPAYEILLHQIPDIFGDVWYEWNHDYKNAQKIFGKGPTCAAVRGLIRTVHKSIYATGLRHTEMGMFQVKSQHLSLIASDQLMTYALMDDRIRFSATGASFFKDFLRLSFYFLAFFFL